MRCFILHESNHRMRVHLNHAYMTMDQADTVEYYLKAFDFITDVKVNDRTADAIIYYDGERSSVIEALSQFDYETTEVSVPEHTGRALSREFENRILYHVMRRSVERFFLPISVRNVITFIKSLPFIAKGIQTIFSGKIQVPLLDAITIGVSMATGDFDTAGSIMFLLGLSNILEEWTHKKSVDDLARSMSLNVDRVWIRTQDGQEVLIPVSEAIEGTHIIVRSGSLIPLDGTMIEGDADVNQASLTGESLPVHKSKGSYVYAGTVIEDGECVIEVKNATGQGRYDKIVKMIEDSEKLNSASTDHSSKLADQLVPYSLGATALTYLITRNAQRALSVLMVDFSCALKMSMPIAVLAAMRECSGFNISVKGGKYLEKAAAADTMVFDKTGTLTYSQPEVVDIIPFNGYDAENMLRLAACLEEHYPHSVANAVVKAAKVRGLTHPEKHSKVQYVVAHGIASMIGDEKVRIGSYHFIFEDEKCELPENEMDKFNSISDEYSHLYMMLNDQLAAVICIEDPLRKEVPDTIQELRDNGFQHLVMMTGDSTRTANAIAKKAGITEVHSEVLPEDKAAYIDECHKEDRMVIMVGDGINDTPALSKADVGIAVSTGAAVAREVADITIGSNNLGELVTMRVISEKLMKRIHGNYRFIIGFNGTLILLGMLGIVPPSITAYMHNFSTLALSVYSETPLLSKKESQDFKKRV